MGQFLCRAADNAAFLFTGSIKTADQIKGMVDQERFVRKQCNVRITQKLVHARVASGSSTAGVKGKAGENKLIDIVVAPAGEAAVSTVNRCKKGGDFLRILDGIKIVVKNVSGKEDKIRLNRIDHGLHSLHLLQTDRTAKMKVCDKCDLKL